MKIFKHVLLGLLFVSVGAFAQDAEKKEKEAKEMEEVLKNAMKDKVIEKEPELEDEEV